MELSNRRVLLPSENRVAKARRQTKPCTFEDDEENDLILIKPGGLNLRSNWIRCSIHNQGEDRTAKTVAVGTRLGR